MAPGEGWCPVKLAVVVSTYNSTEALRKTLLGLLAQTLRADQVLIADDGSTQETALLLKRPQFAPLKIKHLWHPDAGWTKPIILNVALAHVTSDYVVFLDGDTVARSDFLESHARCAQPGYFLSGGRFHVPEHVHAGLSDSDILTGRLFEYDFLYAQWEGVRSIRRRIAPGRWEGLYNLLTYRSCVFHGSNASAWRKDLLHVNGFDESFGYGSEDRDIGVRMRNAGVRSRWLKYTFCQAHLQHPENFDPAVKEANRRIFRERLRSNITRLEPGVDTAIQRWHARLASAPALIA